MSNDKAEDWSWMMKTGDTKIFIKSGNEVRLIERTGESEWVVERTKGASKGKQMICPESALVNTVSN